MKYEFALCAGRHETPATTAIFDQIADPTDFDAMLDTCVKKIPTDADELIIYVTGLTPAMLAVVKVCERRGIDITAMHYDRENKEYKPQQVLAFHKCPWCGTRFNGGDYCPHCGGN